MAVFPALFGLILVSIVTGQTVEITPKQAVRRVGDDLTVLCKVPYPIDSCRMTVGSTPYRLIPSNQDEDVVYSGQGLQFGECGAHIKHIKEEWNGNISCMLPPQSGSIEVTGTMRLVVAKPPANPQLISPPQSNFKEGDIFMAQCVVPNGRPAARITWFLDDDQFLTGVHQPIISSEPGIDLETISQNITKELSADDNGKRLVCRAEHEALDSPKDAARQLVVYYPPKRTESGPITIFGLKIGSEGRLNVTVRSNPPPEAQWTVGDLVITAPQKNEESTITALEPLHLGGGYYNITLVLTAVAKEDVDRTYYLRVTNDLGREEFSLRLSTMDEPAGVELSPGAIAGIIVGVLLVIIVVSLTVYAKATDKWCFEDAESPDNAKSSGESSDTESAVGRQRSRLSALSARVRAVLPRGRDRVQATANAEAEPENVAEEKKGVVYAELALAEQSADKPPPPSTEYAEIVYTDQPGQIKEDKE
ncbi:unnamed protein product [Leptosia nina]|uniref:Ig-like domain-containing protein n=1 Tax=Leptosia nina TaxID=320188 RepID=A0AAV1JED0_9NEOP